MQMRRLYFVLYYLVAAMAIAAFYGSYDWLAYYRLVKKGSVATATVIATDCMQSKTITYRFMIAGQSFTGKGSDGFGTPPCPTLKSGDQLQIAYLKESPQVNLPGDPDARLANETIAVVTAALLVPMVLLFIGFLLLRRFFKKQQ